MIYFVSATQELFDNEVYTMASVKESLDIISNFESHIVQFDTETTGLDPHIDDCLLAQFGNADESIQIVVDCTTVDLRNYKEILETFFVIGQNLKFDAKVAFKYDIKIRRCYDCMVVEQLLHMGWPNFMIGASKDIVLEYCHVTANCEDWDDMDSRERDSYLAIHAPKVSDFIKNYSGVSLQALCHRYLNMYMSKEIRGQIRFRGPTDLEVIKYGAGDVKPLYKIMQAQMVLLKQRGLVKAAEIECNFTPVVAYYEWCGVHMDVPLWESKMAADEEKMLNAKSALDRYAISYGNPKFYYIERQGDLFLGFNTEPQCTINWNSSKQVIPFLTLLGFNCRGIDKKSKEEKDSLDASVLAPQRHINPEFYDVYLAYSEAHKVCSTYGQNYLNAINPKTDRLHTTFRQLGTDTGRLACGSQQQNESLAKLKELPLTTPKDPKLKCAYPQMQNLPADEITRASFCAEKGNAWISVDYCGQESVLMADFSQDKAMMNVFLNGEDMHSTVAYMIYPDDIPRETNIKDIKKLYKHLRQKAKGPEFCFAYAGNDSTLVQQYGMDKDEAKNIYDNYMKGFPGIAKFQQRQKRFVVNNGYILISPVSGHKAYWWDWEYWKEVQSTMDNAFWEEYKAYHKGTGDSVARFVSKHFKAKTKWEKNACNSPLQGSGAVIFKIFNKMLFDWVVDNGYFNIVKFCVPVHDEINVECPIEMQDMVAAKIQEIMKEAAKPFLTKLELDSDASISDHWIH